MQLRKLEEEIKEQDQKKARAARSLQDKEKLLRNANKVIAEGSIENIQIQYDIEKNLTKTLQSGIL